LWRSAIYEGSVEHHRVFPKTHKFSYRLYHLYIDLAEMDNLFLETRWWRSQSAAPAYFRAADYFPGAGSLSDRVRALVQERLGFRPDGAIRLLTHPRTFGISFNPVSFYYCFSPAEELVAVIAEISNIPWLERHCYVLDCRNQDPENLRFSLTKAFHISPFMSMKQTYLWQFSVPSKSLSVQMTSREANQTMFTASLQHQRRAITAQGLDALLWRYPAMPLQVIAAIYFQAGRLWCKGIPFYDHPKNDGKVLLEQPAYHMPPASIPHS
jgi:hypothetical protein